MADFPGSSGPSDPSGQPDPWGWMSPDLAAQWQGYPEQEALAPAAPVPIGGAPAFVPPPEEAAPLLRPPSPPGAGVVEPDWGQVPEWTPPAEWEPPDIGTIEPPADETGLLDNDFSVEAEAQRIAMLPEDAQVLEAHKALSAADSARRTRELEAAARSAEDAQDNAIAYRDSIAQSKEAARRLDEEGKALAGEHIDQGRWMASRSSVQTVAAYLAAALGGFAAGMQGGRNTALDAILGAIDRDIELQKEALAGRRNDIAARRNAVAQQFQLSGDLLGAQEKVRIATLDATAHKIDAEIANLDPRGTAALKLSEVLSGVYAARSAALAAYEDRVRADSYKQIKIDQEQQKIDRSRDYRNRGGIGGGIGGGLSKDTTFTPEGLKAYYNDPTIDVPPANMKMTIAQYGDWMAGRGKALGAKKIGLETTKAEQDVSRGATQGFSDEELARTVPDVTGTPLLQPDNRPLIAVGSEGEIAAAKKTILGGSNIVDLMDKALRLGAGWSPDFWKSKQWRKLEATWAAATLVGKDAFGLNQMSESDFQIVGKLLGARSPTEARNVEDGVRQARENIIELRRNAMGGIGLRDPKRYDPPPIPGPAKKSKDDKILEGLMEGDKQPPKAPPYTPGAFTQDFFEQGRYPAPSAKEVDLLARLRTDLVGKDPAKSAAARARLKALAGQASSRAVRNFADLALTVAPDNAPDDDEEEE